MTNHYTTIGLMSGTSLDGLDLVAVEFTKSGDKWDFKVIAAECLAYEAVWKRRLIEAPELSGQQLTELNSLYGNYLGQQVWEFMAKYSLKDKADLICSHGHTVFHDPGAGYTLQIGDGAQIASVTGIPVVSDLRIKDVSMGGQGAPIVPIGERHLFNDYEMFLNIGGIANISHHHSGKVTAYDICPGNTPLNLLARQQGSEYDEGGNLARAGVLIPELFSQLATFPFYHRPAPKSLHTNVIVSEFMPIADLFPGSLKDKLHTVTEHLAMEISKHINQIASGRGGGILITGGGARNEHLIGRIRHYSDVEVVIPNDTVIDFKEAIIMAFFGMRRARGEVNCLSSVTGAREDTSGGVMHL